MLVPEIIDEVTSDEHPSSAQAGVAVDSHLALLQGEGENLQQRVNDDNM